MPLLSYYEVLDVPRNASVDQIKTAHRTLTKKYHPDVNKSPDTVHIFEMIQQAYEVLSNPARRMIYDRQLRENIQHPPAVNGILVLQTRKDDVLPNHHSMCSCNFCTDYWINNPDQYKIVQPYARLSWYRRSKESTVFADLTGNNLLSKNAALPENIEAARKIRERVEKDRWYTS